jgi:outer membrane protein
MSLKHTILAVLLGLSLVKPVAAEIPSGPITLEQCIKIALENNLDVRISFFGPQIQELSLQALYGNQYDPRLTIRQRESNEKNKGNSDISQYVIPPSEFDRQSTSFGLSGGLSPYGTTYNVGYGFSHRNGFDTRTFPILRPSETYTANFSASITQPLLGRDAFGIGYRTDIEIKKNEIESASISILGQMMTTISNVESAYYSWLAQYDKLKVDQENLALTEVNFKNQRRRAEIGTLAQSELPQLEAELYSQKTSLISAQNSYANSLNTLKRLLSDDFATIRDIKLSPVGELIPIKTVLSLTDSWDKALRQRPEIIQNKIQLENNDIDLKYSKNQLWPSLSLNASYNASGADSLLSTPVYIRDENGIYIRDKNDKLVLSGYTNMITRNKETGDIIDDGKARFKTAYKDVTNLEFPGYTIGLTLNYAIPNRSARAAYKSKKLANERAILNHKKIEQNIMIEIDLLIREANSSFEQITAATLGQTSAELALKNQTKKFQEGASDNYSVLLAQRDLTRQRNQVINAKANYQKALANLALAEGSTLKNNNINVEFTEE